jgi:predicted secreted protein
MPADNIEEIHLKTGESTTVQLKGLSTAGYQWNYVSDDNKNLVSISKDYLSVQKTVGASAAELYTITANNKGIVNISFFQKRNWEKNNNAANEKKIKITIG